jgi:hypothetical protein
MVDHFIFESYRDLGSDLHLNQDCNEDFSGDRSSQNGSGFISLIVGADTVLETSYATHRSDDCITSARRETFKSSAGNGKPNMEGDIFPLLQKVY